MNIIFMTFLSNFFGFKQLVFRVACVACVACVGVNIAL
jgi:hypothetical protein